MEEKSSLWWKAIAVAKATTLAFTTLVLLYVSLYILVFPIHNILIRSKCVCPSCVVKTKSKMIGTTLDNIVFGIGSSSELWEDRKNYVKTWWRPKKLRGFVWLDQVIEGDRFDNLTLPACMISEDTSTFNYTYGDANSIDIKNQKYHIRMSRIVLETFRLNLTNVHWFVMGDDDTIFLPSNLVKILSKYDHKELFYIGALSESHLQNVRGFSSNMAYGGAGYAISYALAKELEKMQDGCLQRYHYLYSGDARIHACLAELGVSLTIERGFHQLDVYGDASGLLVAHPTTPLISLHHINLVDPLFPSMNRVQALEHLAMAIQIDSLGVLQQSICYDKSHDWSIKVSWGYAVQINRGYISPRDLEVPLRTFTGWYGDTDEIGFPFKTLEFPNNPCEQPTMFFMSNATRIDHSHSSSTYMIDLQRNGCMLQDKLFELKFIHVTKEVTHSTWYQAPRRQCCKISAGDLNDQVMHLEVSNCKTGEMSVMV